MKIIFELDKNEKLPYEAITIFNLSNLLPGIRKILIVDVIFKNKSDEKHHLLKIEKKYLNQIISIQKSKT